MSYLLNSLIFLAALAAGSSTVDQNDEQQAPLDNNRSITITVHIVLPDEHHAVPELPYVVYVRGSDRKQEYLNVSLSDPEGVVDFGPVQIPAGYQRVFFSAFLQESPDNMDRETLRLNRERYNALRNAYYWPDMCRECMRPFFDLIEDVGHYDLHVKAYPRVVLTGGVAGAGGPLYRAPIWARFANSRNGTDRNGRIPGLVVPQGVPNEVFTRHFPVVASRIVSHEETLADTDLGVIEIPRLDRSVGFDGTVKRMLDLREERWIIGQQSPATDGITLVSEDAGIILTWMTDAVGQHGTERLTENWEIPLYAPPAIYYVAPGVFHADEVQLGLLDLLRAGVDLANSGIPRIVLKEGEYGGMHEFDALEMDHAIREAMRKHLKPAKEKGG